MTDLTREELDEGTSSSGKCPALIARPELGPDRCSPCGADGLLCVECQLRSKLGRTSDALSGAKSALDAARGHLNPGFEPVETEVRAALAKLEALYDA